MHFLGFIVMSALAVVAPSLQQQYVDVPFEIVSLMYTQDGGDPRLQYSTNNGRQRQLAQLLMSNDRYNLDQKPLLDPAKLKVLQNMYEGSRYNYEVLPGRQKSYDRLIIEDYDVPKVGRSCSHNTFVSGQAAASVIQVPDNCKPGYAMGQDGRCREVFNF